MNFKDMKIGESIVIANDQHYKGHKISVSTNQDGDWVYTISGPVLNDEKSFSSISSSNSTIEKWKKEIDKDEAIELDNEKTANELLRITQGFTYEAKELEFQIRTILKLSKSTQDKDMQAVYHAYEAMERPLREIERHLKEFRKTLE